MTINVLCIGDVMLDVIARINVSPQKINYGSDTASHISTSSGGAAGNVAAWLTRTDARSTIVSHVGDDPAGAAIVAALMRECIKKLPLGVRVLSWRRAAA